MDKAAKRYTISAIVAKDKGIPTTFIAAELVRSKGGAVYLYGHGAADPYGRCCCCGRLLTHPGSILLGIGPECLGSWGARDIRLEQVTELDKRYLETLIRSRIVDTWLPISIIKEEEDVDDMISIPNDHKMLKPIEGNGNSKMTATIDKSGKFVIIRFPYNAEMVSNIRCLEGRRWDGDGKFWSAWASTDNLIRLREWGFELDSTCNDILNPKKVEDVTITEKDLDIPGLYPFQLEGVKFLEARNGNGLIGDEMGLGKTIQTLGWLKLHPEARPAVIVVPASLKINWQREAEKWIGKDSTLTILSGRSPDKKALKGFEIFIINYDILMYWVDTLKTVSPKVMVCDEAHYCKDSGARRTKAVKELGKTVEHTIFLTGTPIVNRPVEFFTILNMLAPTEFNSWKRYTQRYCDAKHNGFGWDVSGSSNTAELFEKVNNKVMVRRKKSDVLKDLPTKQRFVVPMDITNWKTYSRADNDLVGWIKDTFGNRKASAAEQAEALARFSYLKQLAAEGKREFAINWIKDCLDANGKLVVFAVHHVMIDFLAEELRNYNPVVVDGRVDMTKRQEAVDRFQNDPTCRVFIGNVQAAGVGITLTAASNSVFVELGWTPGAHSQAEDRIHRIGQESKVSAYYLIAANTIEEEIAQLLDSKMDVLTKVLDGKETDGGSLLSELLKKRLEGAK